MAKTGLVVSAHPGDFVWRAGGAIALHAKKGYRVKIVCLAFGERGESQFAWKVPGMTLEKVKAGRRDEAERAAAALGAEIEFFDAGDYPLHLTPAHMERLIDIYREINPSFVLTHSLEDPYNVDHPAASALSRPVRCTRPPGSRCCWQSRCTGAPTCGTSTRRPMRSERSPARLCVRRRGRLKPDRF